MPLDAICLAAVRSELSGRITGHKIDKVQQPEKDIVILTLRGGEGPCRLLISAGTGDRRVHLTQQRFDNPASPPMFCMLLRKHLTGARVARVDQPQAERILELELDAPDAMGVISKKRLIIELIGRLSNIVLVDGDGLIIDCLRRVGGDLTEKRAVLPGLLYRRPPTQEGKLDPLAVSAGEWQAAFDANCGGKKADEWILSAFSALSPLICREISWRAYSDADIRLEGIHDGGAALRKEFFGLIECAKAQRFEPWRLVGMDGAPRDFSYTRIQQYEDALDVRREESFSDMLDGFYTKASQLARATQRAAATRKTVKTARDRLIRKLAAQHAELEITAQRDLSRECGDIIMANLHSMKKGQKTLRAQDFFSEDGAMRDIALDPLKTPQQNAARYYKEFSKAKTAEKFLSEQIRLGERELEYLESVLGEISLAEGERDLVEISRELAQAGYIKLHKLGKEKQQESAPIRFESSSGMHIYAGRNNAQNDRLTLKTAPKSDVWLHAQKIHGAHVVISCGGEAPDEATLHEAAAIAAYYSAARGSGKVPVDYTLVRHVKRQPGGRPGMVVYTGQKTIIATPDEALVARLRR